MPMMLITVMVAVMMIMVMMMRRSKRSRRMRRRRGRRRRRRRRRRSIEYRAIRRSRENKLEAASLLSFAKKLWPLSLLNSIEVLASMSRDLKVTWLAKGSILLTAVTTAATA
eukprot:3307382-Pyramimonas_sp.AAC.1